jgi:hypothetical protein
LTEFIICKKWVLHHHDDGCEDDIGQEDADHSDEGFDVEALMRNV